MKYSKSIILILLVISCSKLIESSTNPETDQLQKNLHGSLALPEDLIKPSAMLPVANLEGRVNDRSFVKDIVDRLHALDEDIGKLLYNSTSMYSPNEEFGYSESTKGGEKFTEILADLDSLQDEVSSLINAATRSRQYNILVRLRPLNNIIYRIRNNLYLMRNSLVAINTVSSLEKISNSVLDSTLQVFMRPETNLTAEIGDSGEYDIDLDKIDQIQPDYRPISSFNKISTATIATTTPNTITSSKPATKATTTTSITSTTTTTTTTTTSTTTTTPAPVVFSSSVKPSTRRPNGRPSVRRTRPSRTTTKKPSTVPLSDRFDASPN